jgi:hypothetical protein
MYASQSTFQDEASWERLLSISMLMHCGAMEEDKKAEAERIELSSYPYDERSE